MEEGMKLADFVENLYKKGGLIIFLSKYIKKRQI